MTHINDFLQYDGDEFIHYCYFTLLGRNPDPVGALHYGARLGSGRKRRLIVADLSQSGEARRRGVTVQGLAPTRLLRAALGVPALGAVLRLVNFHREPADLAGKVRLLENQVKRLVNTLEEGSLMSGQRGRGDRRRGSPAETGGAGSPALSPRAVLILQSLQSRQGRL